MAEGMLSVVWYIEGRGIYVGTLPEARPEPFRNSPSVLYRLYGHYFSKDQSEF